MKTSNVRVLDRKGTAIDAGGGQRCRYLFDGREGTGTIDKVQELCIVIAPDDGRSRTIAFGVRYSFRRTAYVADAGAINPARVELI